MERMLLNAYFAGLIDGEGTVNVYPHKNGLKQRPVIKVDMTSEKAVSALHRQFGGTFMKKKVYNGNKPQFRWEVTFHKAVDVAREIRPYLIEKAELADKIILFGNNNPRKHKLKQKAVITRLIS